MVDGAHGEQRIHVLPRAHEELTGLRGMSILRLICVNSPLDNIRLTPSTHANLTCCCWSSPQRLCQLEYGIGDCFPDSRLVVNTAYMRCPLTLLPNRISDSCSTSTAQRTIRRTSCSNVNRSPVKAATHTLNPSLDTTKIQDLVGNL